MLYFIFLTIPLFAELKTADRYFEATLFEQAATLYHAENNREKEVESLFLSGKFDEVIKKLEGFNPQNEELYFLALSYQHQNQYQKMVQTKEAYLNSSSVYIDRQKKIKEELNQEKTSFLIKEDRLKEAELLLSSLNPTPEILFTLIKLKEKSGSTSHDLREIRKQFLETYPESPYHAEVSFELYDFQDYLLGDKVAIHHLNHFVKTYKNSPLSISAWYLIGLDLKNERKPEGKRRIHHKNLELSANAFIEAENLYEATEETLTVEERSYYSKLRHKASLERARTLIEIAEESSGSKRHIYLTYAADTLSSLKDPEAQLLLAQVYIKDKDTKSGMKILQELENSLKNENQPLYYSKTLYEKGKLFYYEQEIEKALNILEKAEEMAPLYALTSDELLEIQIFKSLCHKELKQYDQAMLVLSDVINSDFISSLRIKAMYMRALIYEVQGKAKLAQRQFESVFQKGGQWAEAQQMAWKNEFNQTSTTR